MQYTLDQQRAIEARGSHLLLAAAAGSGKTFTLVERILRLLHEGEDIDRMLIITFTRAAAADMKAKLIRRLTDEAEQNPALEAQLRRVEYASIQTIDAFCAEVVRAHFEAADVDPQFRVPDEAELKQLMARALDAALMDAYETFDDDLQALHFGRGVKGVSELVLSLHRFAENRPDPGIWMERALLDLPEGDGALWFDELARAAMRELGSLLAKARYALTLCQLPFGPLPYAVAVQDDIAQIERALAAADYPALCAALRGYSPMRAPAVRVAKDADPLEPELKERAKALRDDVKKGVLTMAKKLVEPEQALSDMRLNQPAMRALLQVTLKFHEQLDLLKAEKSVLSFSDIAHRALLALRRPAIAQAMRAKFAHIFVDEYQDVSDIQQALIECIQRDDNVFMVGDVKQSIYRFRQAEPSLFIDKYQRYGRGDGGRLIALNQNFRSRASILDFTNRVFERLMVGGDSEIEYDELARLKPGARMAGEHPPVELCVLLDTRGEEDGEDGADDPGALSAAEREGAWIARRILEIKQNRQFCPPDGSEARAFDWRDFAVLVRYRSDMEPIERALTQAGIPVYADAAGGYLGALEVQIFKALLTVIENRRRDKELLSVLHAPFGALSSEQLAQIRLAHPHGSYRDAMLSYMQREDELSMKLRALEEKLCRWRALSQALPLSALLDTVLRESGYYAYVGRMPLGAARQANLDLFVTYASDYDAAQPGALTGFLRYVRMIEQKSDDLGAAHTLGEGDDVVRLITVHKSKGLEFPVVFGARLGRALKRADKIGELSLHRTLGAGLALNDRRLGSRRRTLAQRAIAERGQLEQLNEEMRILYVLLTRAVDRLLLCGSVRDFESALTDWCVATRGAVAPASFLDALMPALLDLPGAEDLDEARGVQLCVGAARVQLRLIEGGIELPERGTGPVRQDAEPDSKMLAAARRALTWRYPFADQVLRPLKLTVSALTRELTGPAARPPIVRRPKFLTQDGLSASERGTLTHAALMHLNLEALRGLSGQALEAEVRAQLQAMRARGQLFDDLKPDLVVRFLTGALGQQLLRADKVRREWAFNLRMRLPEAIEGGDGASVLVQGVIDCCFIEDGQWVLLDYKTDAAGDLDALSAYYRPQLQLYAEALERITGTPVKQKMLCLLRQGTAVEIE